MEDFAQQPVETLKKHNPYTVPVIGIAVCLFLAIPPVMVFSTKFISADAFPTVSPLSETSSGTSTPPDGGPTPLPVAATKIYAPSDYISVSQRYFTDAYILSQKRQQTDEDKQEIVKNLQKAIDSISEGIALYPNNAKLWIQRANFYIAIQHISPQAKEAALQDIQKAQSMSQHNTNQSPTTGGSSNFPKSLEVIKDQQAIRESGQASRDVIVAAPGEASSPYEDSKETSAATGRAVIPAGQKQITVENTYVTDAAPVYVVPTTQTSASISVVAKNAGSGFTVAIDNVQKIDVPFQYWVTR